VRPEAHRPEPVVPERNAPVGWPGHTGPIRTYAGARHAGVASAAQVRWQRSADGSEPMAMAQIRWHRTTASPLGWMVSWLVHPLVM
jgi:hypothetical protein